MTDRYSAIISSLPAAARDFPRLQRLSATTEDIGGGIEVLALRPLGPTRLPVLWYDDVLNDRPQVCTYQTMNELCYGGPSATDTLPPVDAHVMAAILCALADLAVEKGATI